MKIFHKQYKLKKCPSTLKYFPWRVRDHRCRSCIFLYECTSKNSCREISSSAAISNRNWPMSRGREKLIDCQPLKNLGTYFPLPVVVGWPNWSSPIVLDGNYSKSYSVSCPMRFASSCSGSCPWCALTSVLHWWRPTGTPVEWSTSYWCRDS